jgi:hypothetical protein
MLLRTVHIPRIYTDLPPDPYSGQYCALVLSILQGMEENCLLLVDDSELILKEITDGVDRWPPKYRKRAQQALTMLRKRHRFAKVPFTLLPHVGCGRAGCQCAVSIANQNKIDCLLGADNCTVEPADAIRISDFVLSAFEARRRASQRYELADGEWDKSEFERNIWEPLFRDAKHVKLFDRMLGRTVTESQPPAVKQNFVRGFDWVFEQFAKHNVGRSGSVFEVTSALKQSLTPPQTKTAAETLRRFARDLSNKYGVPMTMKVKRETGTLIMPHDRFMFTDQIALWVSRGFDLLDGNGNKVRDVIIRIVTDPGKIESRISRLPDAP